MNAALRNWNIHLTVQTLRPATFPKLKTHLRGWQLHMIEDAVKKKLLSVLQLVSIARQTREKTSLVLAPHQVFNQWKTLLDNRPLPSARWPRNNELTTQSAGALRRVHPRGARPQVSKQGSTWSPQNWHHLSELLSSWLLRRFNVSLRVGGIRVYMTGYTHRIYCAVWETKLGAGASPG